MGPPASSGFKCRREVLFNFSDRVLRQVFAYLGDNASLPVGVERASQFGQRLWRRYHDERLRLARSDHLLDGRCDCPREPRLLDIMPIALPLLATAASLIRPSQPKGIGGARSGPAATGHRRLIGATLTAESFLGSQPLAPIDRKTMPSIKWYPLFVGVRQHSSECTIPEYPVMDKRGRRMHSSEDYERMGQNFMHLLYAMGEGTVLEPWRRKLS